MKHTLVFIAFLVVSAYSAKSQDDAVAGKQLFTTQLCASCHAIGKQLVGPDLKDIDKAQSEQWIMNFVRSSQSVIKSGDPRAVEIFNQYNKVIMPDHPDIKDQDIKNILAYIKQESQAIAKNAQNAAASAIESRPYRSNGFFHHLVFLDVTTPTKPLGSDDPILWLVMIAVVALLSVLLLLVRSNNKKSETKS
jgi:cytochrome c551/c552